MAPVQQTFELIPNAIGSGLGRPGLGHDASAPQAPAKPPMTSKQAKKLYKQANKAPKLSKAEQRRMELMEQDRIRKELEKEKAQARARVARERKKAKEEAQREAKKKKGLPLIDVRPSQDTIARFVRGNGNGQGKKRDSTGAELHTQQHPPIITDEENDGHSDKENEHRSQSPAIKEAPNITDVRATPTRSGCSVNDMIKPKKLRIDPALLAHTDASQRPEDVSRGCTPKASRTTADIGNAPSQTRAVKIHEDGQPQLTETRPLTTASVAPTKPVEEEDRSQERIPNLLPSSRVTTCAPEAILSNQSGRGTPDESIVGNRLLSTPVSKVAVRKTPHAQPTIIAKSSNLPLESSSAKAPSSSCSANAKPSPRPGVNNHGGMGPPPVPPRFKAPGSSQPNASQRPRFLSKHQQPHRGVQRTDPIVCHVPKAAAQPRPVVVRPELLPTSTQFVLSHLDEFLPSPSQESRELLEERQLCTASDITPSKPVAPESIHPPVVRDSRETALALDVSFFSTQDLFMSSQDMRELESSTTPSSKAQRAKTGINTVPLLSQRRPPTTNTDVDLRRRLLQPTKPRTPGLAAVPDSLYLLRAEEKAKEMQFAKSSQASKLRGKEYNVEVTGTMDSRLGLPTYCSVKGQARSGTPAGVMRDQIKSHPSEPNVADRHTASHPSRALQHTTSNERNRLQGSSGSRSSGEEDLFSARLSAPQNLKQPPQTAPPPKKRLFSSSGIGADSLCAMERSHRMFQKEQRKGEIEIQARERLRHGSMIDKREVGCPVPSPAGEVSTKQISKPDDEEDLLGDDLDCVLPSQILRVVERGSTLPPTNMLGRPSETARPFSGASWSECRPKQPPGSGGLLGASQETDYGDFELGSDDLDLLGVAA